MTEERKIAEIEALKTLIRVSEVNATVIYDRHDGIYLLRHFGSRTSRYGKVSPFAYDETFRSIISLRRRVNEFVTGILIEAA